MPIILTSCRKKGNSLKMELIQDILNNYNFNKWVSFVDRFMSRYRLWPQEEGTAWVAASGGKDSTLLLWSMYLLFKRKRIQKLKILHFNHKTRSECHNEEEIVAQHSKLLQLPLEIGYPISNLGKSNLEHIARRERYAFFKKTIASGDRVYLGHHLNDSLEWSLMSRFKSSRLKPQLGIPVINGAFARPFFCVTQEQITKMAKKIKLNWLKDSSNQNLRFERNFLRLHVLPPIKQRFPTYLRHYVASSNNLARRLGVWRGNCNTLFTQKELPLGGIRLFNFQLDNNFRGAEELIREIVEKLSLKKRGCLTLQVDKMIEAAANGRQGPIFFSGSVRGYITPGILFFVRTDDLDVWEQYDRALVQVLNKKNSLKSVPFLNMGKSELVEYIGKMPFPPIGLSAINKGWKPTGQHFLLPKTSSLCRKRGWRLNYLVEMAKKMGKDGKKGRILPLDLLVQMDNFYCTRGIPNGKIKGTL